MAYLVVEPVALTPTTTAAANYPITIASLGLTLVDDDWLILSVICSATSGTLSTASSGWSEIASAELGVTSGNRMARYKAKVASGTVGDVQIDLSAGTGQWSGCIEQWRDADATDCIDSAAVSAGSSGGAVASEVSGTLTPGTNNCAISYFSSARLSGSLPVLRFKSDEVVGRVLQSADDGTIFRSIALGTVQQTTRAATEKTLYTDRSSRIGTITVAIKNKSGGGITPDCRAGVEKMAWMGTFGTAHESLGTTWGAPSTFVAWTGGTIGGITADTNAPTINNDTSGAGLPWGAFTSVSSNVNTAGALVGGWIALPATIDLTSKFVFLEWFFTLMGTTVGAEGAFLALGDNATASTGNAVVYRLAPKSAVQRDALNSSVIDPATATTFDTEGSINLATINKVGFFYHRVGNAVTARALIVRNLLAVANSIMVGGNAGKPLDIRFLDAALNGWGYTGVCEKQGDAVLVKTDVQFGDGTIPTYVDTTATLLNTPAAYSTSTQPFWNAAANSITVGMKAASGDTMNFKASAMAAGAGAEQNFTIDPATSATGNYSFQGEVISNFLFAGDTDVPIVGATYSGCDEVAFGGADVTSVTITDTTSADAACSFDANGVVMTSSTIDGTGALYAIELGTAVTAITLASCTITAGSTDKVHVKATTGTVTITISGTTSLAAGDVTTDGATVVIAAPELYQSVTVSGAIANSQIHVADVDYTLTVSGITITPTAGATYTNNDITWTVVSASITAGAGTIVVYGLGSPETSGTLTKASGTGDASVAFSAFVRNVTTLYNGAPTFPYTWTDSVAAAAARAIRLRVAYCQTTSARSFIESYIGVCGITDGTESVSYNASQVADATYNTHALDGPAILALGEITISDLGTDLITVDTAGGTMGWPTIYAAFVAWMASSSGIDDEIAYCDSPDPVNFIWENTRIKCPLGTALSVTDGWGRDSVTGLSITLWNNTGGAIGFSADHGIGYSTGSGLTTAQNAKLMALPAAIDIAEEVVNGITF